MLPFVAFYAARSVRHDRLWITAVYACLAWAEIVCFYALITLVQWFLFRCPRCGWRFGHGAKCSSCGLPRSAPLQKNNSPLTAK